jgi:RNA polymerase sigma factor (sigma-70 family)
MTPVQRLLSAVAGSDVDLLSRYARHEDHEAFAELVRRYRAGVWAACVRLAGRDAEDAFQATFLVLARKAASVTGPLPAWLHGVTRRVAANLRREARRRAAAESGAARADAAAPPDPGLREGLALLDEELARLPDHYRAVMIVCCLEGRSRDEAAVQLGWSEGQVKGRLERARELLRARLARRGVELSGVLLAAAVARPLPAAGGPPSPAVESLTNGVIRDMAIQKVKVAAILATVVVGVGALLAGGTGPEAPADEKAAPPVKAPDEAEARAAWGKAEGGLRLGLLSAGPGRVSVVFENVGRADAVLNLGIMLGNGKTQLPTAVRLTLTDATGKMRKFERRVGGVAGRVDPFVVPLPAGGRYVLPFAPAECIDADAPGVPLAPGGYRVAAEFTGEKVGRTNTDSGGLALMPYWTGTLRSGDVNLDVPAGGGEPPDGAEKAGDILWGEEVKGLQAGIGLRGDRKAYRIGEEVPLRVNVRNVGKEPARIRYSSALLRHSRPEVEDATGGRVTGVGENRLVMPPAVRYVIPVVEGVLKPGEEMTFARVQLKLAPANARGAVQPPELQAAPGEYSIRYAVWLGTDPLPVTGKLKFVVQPAKGGE